jgi:hypothetical protein
LENILQKILSRHYPLAEFANMLADPINATIEPNSDAPIVGLFPNQDDLEGGKRIVAQFDGPLKNSMEI